jgi:L-fucose isomerase-like protein
LARKTYDFEAARDIYQRIQGELQQLENVTLEFVDDLIFEDPDAEKAGQDLATKDIDGLVLIVGTFHLGELALVINRYVKKSILLWALEELPYNGGRIRLNSICGLNLTSSNLYKSGIRDYHVCIGNLIDQDWVDAIRIKHVFSRAKIGLVGFHAKGFVNLGVDEPDLYRVTGTLIEHYELADLFGLEVTDDAVEATKARLTGTFSVSGVTDEQVDKVASMATKLDAFVLANQLNAVAIRCWPEFAATFGISPCAAMSLIQSDGRILACEGDILGAMSMLAHQSIGAETPFLADFSQVNLEENFALLWHCGVAPCNTWDGACEISLDTYFAGGKGVTADFVLKPGDLSIARIDYCTDGYRLFLQEAKAVPMDKLLKGTYAKAVFNGSVRDVLDKVVMNGIAHHVSVVYGQYIKPLEIFAKLAGWTIIK